MRLVSSICTSMSTFRYLFATVLWASVIVENATAQVVDHPEWAGPVSAGGADPRHGLILPEYVGAFPEMVDLQFPAAGRFRGVSRRMQLRFSASSGVLAIADFRGTTATKYGWNTGFSRVLALDGGKPGVAAGSTVFLGAGWDNGAQRSKLFRLTIPGSGVVSQQALAIESANGEIWAVASEIGDQIIIYDIQNHSILRFVDTDSNGIADSRDQQFYIAVPQDVSTSRIALRLNPISQFIASSGSVAEIASSDILTRGSQKALIVSGPSGFSISFGPYVPLVARGQIVGGALSAQRRLMVAGPAGYQFRIVREVVGSADLPISSSWTIPNEKIAYVDLTTAVQATWRIRVVPVNTGEASSWVSVRTSTNAALFPFPTPTFAPDQGSDIVLEGDKFRATFVAYTSYDGPTGVIQAAAPTTFASSRKLKVSLPVIGSPTALPPFLKATVISIVLRDSSTGVDVSDPITCTVKHD